MKTRAEPLDIALVQAGTLFSPGFWCGPKRTKKQGKKDKRGITEAEARLSPFSN